MTEAGIEEQADDMLAGVAYLKSRKDVQVNRIGLIGHSEGGMVAPLAASRSKDVAFIVLLAAPGVTGEEILMRQLVDAARAEKQVTQEDLAKALVRHGKIDETFAPQALEEVSARLLTRAGRQ